MVIGAYSGGGTNQAVGYVLSFVELTDKNPLFSAL